MSNVPELRFPEFSGSWKLGYLGDLVDSLDAGISVNSGDTPAKNNQQGILKTSCVSKGVFDPQENKVVDNDHEISRLKEPVKADSVIISRMNTPALVGANSFVNKDYPNLFLPDRLWAGKINKNHIPSWVGILISHSKTRAIFSARGTGTSGSMKNITKGDVLTAPVIYPDKEEQQKIAIFLSAVDKKLGHLRRKHELLESYKRGIMQKIFSPFDSAQGKPLRFKQDNGTDFPDWEEKRLGDVIELISGLTYTPDNVKDSGLLVLRSSNVQEGKLKLGDNVFVNLDVEDKYLTRRNDILLCVRNGSRRLIGKTALIGKNLPRATHGAFMTVLRGKENQFIFQLLQTPFFYKEVHKNLGATINSINGADLKKFKFILPTSEEEKQKIANFLSTLDKKLEAVQKQIDQTEVFKKGLLQKMFV